MHELILLSSKVTINYFFLLGSCQVSCELTEEGLGSSEIEVQ